jgi:lysophospholipid acyltransferase (LPLAT)-like uncharacterized protein
MLKKILKSKFSKYLLVYGIRFYVWLIFSTCKMDLRFNKDAKSTITKKQHAVFAYWHSRILIFTKLLSPYGRYGIVASSHGDAELLAILVKMYGHRVVRGSSTKGSINAMRGILELIRTKTSFGITPDGPRGPRFKIKGSVTTLASKYRFPIIPMSYSASKAIVLRSWDRFIIPIPFISTIIVDIGKPIYFNKQDDSKLESAMLSQTMSLDKELNIKIDY